MINQLNARIALWKDALYKLVYEPVGSADFEAYITKDHLNLEQAQQQHFDSMPVGTSWGKHWEYGWFHTEITAAPATIGKRLFLDPGLPNEGLVFVNANPKGSLSKSSFIGGVRQRIELCEKAEEDAQFDVYIEFYAGHPLGDLWPGPIPYGKEALDTTDKFQSEVSPSTYGIFHDDLYQLWLDVETLNQIRLNSDTNSLRYSKLFDALLEATYLVDLEAPYETMLRDAAKARKRLEPELACVNGSSMPTFYAFGHAHLDVAWLWPLEETKRKAARTLANQLDLMEKYPEYIFNHSQPQLFQYLKTLYPELYERAKAKVLKGQIVPEGGMWVEADTNITGGESLIRQFLLGKKFVQDEFAYDCQLLWLPDVFGYSGVMPQIMKGCGIKYFSTSKIAWNYSGSEAFPYNNFYWTGIDGTRVLSNIFWDYNASMTPQDLLKLWNERLCKDSNEFMLQSFGWGDGGGGPTEEHLEYIKREQDLEGVPKVRLAGPLEFFHDLERSESVKNEYVGELYFTEHRGTYTSQALTKKLNRQAEMALRETEFWSTAAICDTQAPYPYVALDRLWKNVLLNQFHDIIPGSSIERVYQEANALYQETIAEVRTLTDAAMQSLISEAGDALTVSNSLGFARKTMIQLPDGVTAIAGGEGSEIPCQKLGGNSYALVDLPSGSLTEFSATSLPEIEPKTLEFTGEIENDLLRIRFNEWGEITSIVDKKANREVVKSRCNQFKLYRDVPVMFDAWDIDATYRHEPVMLEEKPEIQYLSRGPLFDCLRITRTINCSQLRQDIVIYKHSKRIDFKTTVDWKERHKLLKTGFDFNVTTNEVVNEIQFGHIRRPNHFSRQDDKDRFEVCQQKWSCFEEGNYVFALLNDCKYGISAEDSSLNLTLLRAPVAPDPNADQGQHEFCYSLYLFQGSFSDSDHIQQAYDLNVPAGVHAGRAALASFVTIDSESIQLESMKLAEDQSGDLILRFYESKRMTVNCVVTLNVDIKQAFLANMLEEIEGELSVENQKISLHFTPFEIKTLRLKRE